MRLALLALVALAVTATPASAPARAQGVYVPPGDSSRMQFAQNGTKRFGSTPLSDMRGKRALVWAGTEGVFGVGVGFYVPCCRDPLSYTGSGTPPEAYPHNLAWFRENHPDWLMYGGPGRSVPSTGGSGNLYALDIVNPMVRRYMAAYALGKCPAERVYPTCEEDLPAEVRARKGALTGGFAYVSFDNLSVSNGADVVGYYAGAKRGCPGGPPACGGEWRVRYDPSKPDPEYAGDAIDYARVVKSFINAEGVGLWTNNKVYKENAPASIKLALLGDASLRESPYLHACDGSRTEFVEGSNWLAQLKVARATYQQQVVAHFNYLCNRTARQATGPEIAYAVANFYLVRDNRTYFEMQNGGESGDQDAGSLVEYSDPYTVYLGAPVEGPPAEPNSSGGCYQRRFKFGMVVVWPFTTGSCSYTVPSGDWKNQFGSAISPGERTLKPDVSTGVARANAVVLKRGD